MASSAQTPHAQPADQLDNRRTIAAAIDCGPFVVAAAALLGAGLLTPATALVVLAWMAYYGFAFESGGAQTPGKKAMKLKTVDANGRPPTMRQAGIRNVLRIADLPLVGLLVMIASGEHRQRLGDKAAGTYVVEAGTPAVEDQAVTRQLATLAPGHVPAEPPVPAKKPSRKTLGGPELKLPKLGRRPRAPKPQAETPVAPKPKRKTLGGPEIKLPKLGRRPKAPKPQAETPAAAKPKRKTLGGPEIKLPSFGRRKKAQTEPPAPAAPVLPDPVEPVGHEPEPVVAPEPVVEPDRHVEFDPEPQVSIDREPEVEFDREPDVEVDPLPEPSVSFDHEPEVTIEPEPEVTYDREPEIVVDREPTPDPVEHADDDEDPTIEVKPIETVSAIDLVMQDADRDHRPGA